MGGAGLAGVAIAGCGDDDDDDDAGGAKTTATASAQQPKVGGTLKTAGNIAFNHLDVLHADGNSGREGIYLGVVYEPLLDWDVGPNVDAHAQKLVPGLAASIPESPDPATLVIKINPAAKFSTGAPVTAEDVKFTLDMVREKGNFKAQLRGVDSVAATDAKTVQLKLKRPSAALLSYLASPGVSIVPKADYERLGDFKEQVIGSGPYKLDSYEAKTRVALIRDANHWKGGKEGFAERIEWSVIPDASTRLAAYQAGRTDLEGLYPFMSKSQRDQVASNDTEFFTAITPYNTVAYLNTAKPPFNDERVRKALNLAINRQEIMATWAEGAGKFGGPLPPVMSSWALSQDELGKLPGFRASKDEDIKEAKRLLEAAGNANPEFNLTIVQGTQTSSPITQVVARSIERAGFKPKIDTVEVLASTNKLQAGDFHALVLGSTSQLDPDDVLSTFYHSTSPRNYVKTNDKRLDDMIDKQSAELNQQERKKQIDEIQKYIIDKTFYGYTVDADAFVAYRKAKLRGYYYNLYSRTRALRFAWLAG